MQQHTRTAKILVSLVASMTLGALILMAVDNQSLSAGPFSLASYTSLSPVEEAASNLKAVPRKWDCLQVYHSTSAAQNIKELASAYNLKNSGDLNFHFVIFKGPADGQIQDTSKWQKQQTCTSGRNWNDPGRTIRICVIAGTDSPTQCQVKRTTALVESLARKFNVSAQKIAYPANWQL